MDYVLIMAGGMGSRFWPASTEQRPKQFLDILGTGRSLLQLTCDRFRKLLPPERIYVLTNERYRSLVQEQLPELPATQILGEPSRNDTAPCIAYAAFKLHALDPEANFVVTPSDQIILKEDAFLEKIEQGLRFTASHSALLTLGIQPHRPHTGYGYIHYDQTKPVEEGIYPVLAFKEKPDAEKAKTFLASGDYLWNAGIFLWQAGVVLDAFRQNAPEIYELLQAGAEVYNTGAEGPFLRKQYPQTPSISVDYAIMEKASNIYTLPADIGWSDLGSWRALYELQPKDEQENVLISGRLIAQNASRCLIKAPADKHIVLRDLHDYIVVDTEKVLFIYPMEKEQEVKPLSD